MHILWVGQSSAISFSVHKPYLVLQLIWSFYGDSFLTLIQLFGCWHHVEVGCVADVPEEWAASLTSAPLFSSYGGCMFLWNVGNTDHFYIMVHPEAGSKVTVLYFDLTRNVSPFLAVLHILWKFDFYFLIDSVTKSITLLSSFSVIEAHVLFLTHPWNNLLILIWNFRNVVH